MTRALLVGGPLAMLDLTRKMGAPCFAFETWENFTVHQPPKEVSLSPGRAGSSVLGSAAASTFSPPVAFTGIPTLAGQ